MNEVLRALPYELAKNLLRTTAKAGADVFKEHALIQLGAVMKSRAPRDDDIVVKQRRSYEVKVTAIYDVGPPRRRPELRWLHSGTRAHPISATVIFRTRVGGSRSERRRGVTRQGRIGVAVGIREGTVLADIVTGRWFGRQVEHPGQMPTFWLQAAQHHAEPAVFKAMAEAMRKGLPRQVRRLASSKFTKQLGRKLLKSTIGI